MNNKYGIAQNSYKLILEAFKKFKEIEKVVLFGSRAMGNYKAGSDIDLALYGETVNLNTISKLSSLLNEELPIPYQIDILSHQQIKAKALKDHIENEGHIIYQGSKGGT